MADVADPRLFFSQHHEAYGTSPRHARGRDLDVLVAGINPKSGETGLDVATGAGHTALRLARAGVQVTVADITVEMLQDAVALASRESLTLLPVEAYAESLPFDAGRFDIVTCRRAAHHFRDVHAFLEQAHRVLSPGGRLGISDMTGSAAGIDWLNRLERLRDPSHNRALCPDAWYDAVVAAGFDNITIQLMEEPLGYEEWLGPVRPDAEEGLAALAFLRQADAPIEFVRAGTFIKRRLLLWAERQPRLSSR